jgi:hypothetical protein
LKSYDQKIDVKTNSSVSVYGEGLKAGAGKTKGWFQWIFSGSNVKQDDGAVADVASSTKREKFDNWYSGTPDLLPSDQKLPQSRMYLKSAKWGFDALLKQQLSDYGYRFYIIGILAALRAVQHSLHAHDRNLTLAHQRIIAAWWKKTSDPKLYPDLQFIKNARNQILKAGSFESYATNLIPNPELKKLAITRPRVLNMISHITTKPGTDTISKLQSSLRWFGATKNSPKLKHKLNVRRDNTHGFCAKTQTSLKLRGD